MPERDLDQLHRTLLRYIRSAGHGRWRIPQDVVDQAYDKAAHQRLDKLLEPDANPEDLRAYASRIALNLVKRGPERFELNQSALQSMQDRAPEDTKPSDYPAPAKSLPPLESPESTRVIDRILEQLVDRLTAAESAAVRATPGASNTQSAAKAAGMSPWNYRTRIRRAADKIRAFRSEEPD